jgi:hypothetical protein
MSAHIMLPETILLGALLIVGIIAVVVIARNDDEPEAPPDPPAQAIEDHWERDEHGRKTRWDGSTFQPERGVE